MSAETVPNGALHGPGHLFVKDFAMRWWKEPGQVSRVQIALMFLRGGKVNFTIGHTVAREWLKDLTDAMSNGDQYHYFIYDPNAQGFVMNRERFAEFREKLGRMVELGPKSTPLKGFSSDSMQTALESVVSVQSGQNGRWV